MTKQPVKIATREEVEKLKSEWLYDPIWDIGDTNDDEFAPYAEELKQFQTRTEERWEAERNAASLKRCTELGCSPAVMRYLERLESAVDALEEKVFQLQHDLLNVHD